MDPPDSVAAMVEVGSAATRVSRVTNVVTHCDHQGAAGDGAVAAGHRASDVLNENHVELRAGLNNARVSNAAGGGGDGGGGAAGQPRRQSSGSSGRGSQSVWLTPWLLGYANGRPLLAGKSSNGVTVGRLSIIQELAAVSYGYARGDAEERPVTVIIKVPQGPAVLLSGGVMATVAAAGGRGCGTAAGYSGDDSAGTGVSAGCWPGVELVAVRRFEAAIRWNGVHGRGYMALTRMAMYMRGFVGWRLFACEVVSRELRGDRNAAVHQSQGWQHAH